MTAEYDPQDFLNQAARLWKILEETPEDFAKEVKARGISIRKAYYLVGLHKTFVSLPVSKDRLRKIGWTKLQVIAPGLKMENLEFRLALAEKHPVHKLKEVLQDDQNIFDDTKKRAVLLYMHPDDYELFAKVLKAHGAIPVGKKGLKDQEKALIAALGKLQ